MSIHHCGGRADPLTTRTLWQDGSYIVNGLKKWITGGLFADFFTCAARTGEPDSGMFGVSLLLIEKSMPGVSVRPMECMGVKGSGTAYVEFDDVKAGSSLPPLQ